MDYEKRWKCLLNKWGQVNVYGIEAFSIGETIPRIFALLYDKEKRDEDCYDIILPTFVWYYDKNLGVVNKKILEIFAPYVDFVTEDNIGFWQYVFGVHLRKINRDVFDLYKYRKAVSFYNEDCKAFLTFNDNMQTYALIKKGEMGIKGEYICLHARENRGKLLVYSRDVDYARGITSVANVDINSFKQAAEYLFDLGYQTVRMGKYERNKCEFRGSVDYANNFYDEFMDFYLIANCKFMVGSASGLTAITPFFGRPVLMTNLSTFSCGFEGLAYTKYDLYIPKKFYSVNKKRWLNLYEMIDITDECERNDDMYMGKGIEIYDNTGEEILEAVQEMNAKIDNSWEITDEEKKCMEEYWNVVNLWKSRHKTAKPREKAGAEGYVMMPFPICYSYLKRNMYLLNMNESL